MKFCCSFYILILNELLLVKLQNVSKGFSLPKPLLFLFLLLAVLALATAFGINRSAPARAVENYYQAASQNDASRLDALSCSPSKTMAGPITRMPDYSTERLRVVKLNCRTTFREGGYAIVACASEVYHTINGQENLIDMGSRTFHLSLEAGNWCVYGFNQP